MPQGIGYGLLTNPMFAGGVGLLAAGGPSRFPVGLGTGLLQGMNAALLARQADAEHQREQVRAQLAQAQLVAAQQQAKRDAAFRSMAPEFLQGTTIPPALGPFLAPKDVATLLKPVKKGSLAQKIADFTAANNGIPPTQAQLIEMAGAAPDKGTSITNVMGGGFEAKSPIGKLVTDLAALRGLPPSRERDAGIAALEKEIANLPEPGAEERRSSGRMATVGEISEEFHRIASKIEAEEGAPSLLNPGATGPVGGRTSRVIVGAGGGGEDRATLVAMEAQMRALLGTALSGAAIPESEWPTYQAQVPSIHDTPAVRAGKIKAYGPMIEALRAQAVTNPAAQTGAVPVLPADPMAPPPRKTLKFGDLPGG